MKLLIVGPGAIGGTLAACLSRNNVEVSLLVRDVETKSRLQKKGLQVGGVRGSFTAYPNICTRTDLAKMAPIEGCFIATKATQLAQATQDILPYLHPEGFVCSLQNGITDPLLISLVGKEKAVGSVITWGATQESLGIYHLTADGDLTLGTHSTVSSPFLEESVEILHQAFPTKLTDQIFPLKYSKLLINSCMTSVGALSGLDLGPTLRLSVARKIFIEIVREGMALADAIHLDVPPFGGKLDYRAFLKGDGLLSEWRRHAIIRMVGFKYRRLTSSSLQSLRKGQQTEVDYLNGYLVEQGKAHGLSFPVNEKICTIIHSIEDEMLPIQKDNLYLIPLP